MSHSLIENTEAKQYEFHIGDQLAFIQYIKVKDKIYLTHTEVPKALGGQGIASGLVKAVLNKVEEEGRKLYPLCPFVAAYLKRHPEWQRLLADGIKVG